MGVSVGPAVTSGRLWTAGGKRPWQAFALLANGEPVIGSPQFAAELRAGRMTTNVNSFNTPFAQITQPVLYTRDFRASVKSEKPFRATVIGNIRPGLPIRLASPIKGKVLRVVDSTTEIAIPEDALVLVEPVGISGTKNVLRAGQRVRLNVDLQVAGRSGSRDVIGGTPVIVRGGVARIEGEAGENLRKRHPRTAVCYNDSRVIFTVVDGRQPSLSVGMTLDELGRFMVSLGCMEAMNTDGGGSSVMAVVDGNGSADGTQASAVRIVNSPSDGKERGRGNAWIVAREPAAKSVSKGKAVRILRPASS